MEIISVLFRDDYYTNKKCMSSNLCQEAECLKKEGYTGGALDICDDGCVQGKRRFFAITLLFEWRDLWVGAFWDSKKKWLYVLPFPMFGIILKFKQ